MCLCVCVCVFVCVCVCGVKIYDASVIFGMCMSHRQESTLLHERARTHSGPEGTRRTTKKGDTATAPLDTHSQGLRPKPTRTASEKQTIAEGKSQHQNGRGTDEDVLVDALAEFMRPGSQVLCLCLFQCLCRCGACIFYILGYMHLILTLSPTLLAVDHSNASDEGRWPVYACYYRGRSHTEATCGVGGIIMVMLSYCYYNLPIYPVWLVVKLVAKSMQLVR